MNVGKLDRNIDLQTQTTTRDDFGQVVETWTTLASVWGGKADVLSSEVTSAGQVVEILRTVWTVRFRNDISTKHRIRYRESGGGLTYFYITGLQEIGRRVGLKITTERRE